ncbi:hypothetical protein FGB62_116g020 [Gracilaria domingensis]|nr:hypothetical protein FGB62_116g020 [Gracilaria domingensis]
MGARAPGGVSFPFRFLQAEDFRAPAYESFYLRGRPKTSPLLQRKYLSPFVAENGKLRDALLVVGSDRTPASKAARRFPYHDTFRPYQKRDKATPYQLAEDSKHVYAQPSPYTAAQPRSFPFSEANLSTALIDIPRYREYVSHNTSPRMACTSVPLANRLLWEPSRASATTNSSIPNIPPPPERSHSPFSVHPAHGLQMGGPYSPSRHFFRAP